MNSSAKDLVVKCTEMTGRLMQAAGFLYLPDEIAKKLANGLPGYKIVEIDNNKKKFIATLYGSEGPDTPEKYRVKVTLDPQNASLKMDTFYIVDDAQRGQGIGKKGTSNIYDLATSEPKVNEIGLKADLDMGALVWAKLAFKAHAGDFAKVQDRARERLHKLQDDLPDNAKIDTEVFGMVDHLLDSGRMKDPRALWAIADLGIQVSHSFDPDGQLVAEPKKLNLILLEWLEYRAKLDLSNREQTGRIEAALGRTSVGLKKAFSLTELADHPETAIVQDVKIHGQKPANFNPL